LGLGSKLQDMRISNLSQEAISNINHELRSPVASIKISLELLGKALGDKHSDSIFSMQNRLDILLSRIDEMLALLELSKDDLELSQKNFSVKELGDSFSNSVSRNGIQVRSLLNDDLYITGDMERISQMLGFFARFIAKDSSEKEITLDVNKLGLVIELKIYAAKFSLSPQEYSRLIDITSMPSIIEAPGNLGLGIGLLLANTIANLHKGSVMVFTEGTLGGFRITLPNSDG
jgi:signal transduction histidine kinase